MATQIQTNLRTEHSDDKHFDSRRTYRRLQFGMQPLAIRWVYGLSTEALIVNTNQFFGVKPDAKMLSIEIYWQNMEKLSKAIKCT